MSASPVPSSTLLMPAVATKSNVLQPLDGGSRNQNLLKLNVTSARADSTAEGNAENVGNSSSNAPANTKGRKPTGGGRGKAAAKGGKGAKAANKAWMEVDKQQQVLGPLQIIKHHHSVKKFQTPSVSRRNARERNRVKQVNSGFATLKHHVPNLKSKTSKVDTLRAAVDYIKTLRELIGKPLGKKRRYTIAGTV